MTGIRRLTLVVAAVLLAAVTSYGQGTIEDYRRAERFLGDAVRQLVFEGDVSPRWIDNTSRFWYLNEKPEGKEFILADPVQATRRPAFDHGRLASALSQALGKAVAANALPFDSIAFAEEGRAVRFSIDGVSWTCNLSNYECTKGASRPEDEPSGEGGNRRSRPPDAERQSPDSKYAAFVRDHNLWIRILATGEHVQLSRDGEHFYDYATPLASPTLMVQQGTEDVIQQPAVFWSPDSKKIATYVMDQRNFPRLTMVQSAPPDQFRPKSFSYAYPLPVDFEVPEAGLVIFDVESRRQTAVAAPPQSRVGIRQPALPIP